MEKFNDVLLEGIVAAMNKTKGAVGLTITVSGFLVTGTLISGSEYFDILIKQNEGGVFHGAFSQFKETIYPDIEPEDKKDKGVSYIHLKDAKFLVDAGTTGIPTRDGMLWLGKLNEVNGFHLWVTINQSISKLTIKYSYPHYVS